MMLSLADQQMSAVAFGQQHPSNQGFFKARLQEASQFVDRIGEGALQRMAALHDSYHGSAAQRIARAALNQVVGIFQADTYREINTLAEFQIATPRMQRVIMAHPGTRELFHRQLLDGYSNTYVDPEPGKIGEDQYMYRRINNGIVDDSGVNWKVTEWCEDLQEGDTEPMAFDDQVDALSTWRSAAHFLEHGVDDHTSIWNTKR